MKAVGWMISGLDWKLELNSSHAPFLLLMTIWISTGQGGAIQR